MNTETIIAMALVALVMLGFRLLAGSTDYDRISSHVKTSGGYVTRIHWVPFGPGWFGTKGDRIYEVRYVDREGSFHQAYCKTSAWSGVYFTEDRVIHRQGRHQHEGPLPDRVRMAALEAENRTLRAELQERRKR